MPNKLREVTRHCANVTRKQHTADLGCDSKNVRIGSAVRDNTGSSAKID